MSFKGNISLRWFIICLYEVSNKWHKHFRILRRLALKENCRNEGERQQTKLKTNRSRSVIWYDTLVLAAIQLDVSESSSHFLIHLRRRLQRTGSCQLLPQAKQNVWLQRHVTGRDSTCCTRITLEQSGLGHHLNNLWHWNEVHNRFIIYSHLDIDLILIEALLDFIEMFQKTNIP